MISRRRPASVFLTERAGVPALFIVALLTGAPLTTPLVAADDPLPIGHWVDRRTGVELFIQRKNEARFSHPQKSSALIVEFANERRVRREYWLAVKKISRPADPKSKPAEKAPGNQPARPAVPGASPWEVKPQEKATTTDPKAKTGNTPKQAAAPLPELQLPWLSADSRLIVSYLIERPPPVPPKQKPARKKKPAQPQQKQTLAPDKAKAASRPKQPAKPKPSAKNPERPRGPRPILELLVFRKGALVFEGVFDPYQPPKRAAKPR